MKPEDEITRLVRLHDVQRAALRHLGIRTVGDLLHHLPARYDVGGESASIAGLVPGSSVTIFGTITKLETRRSWKRKIPVGEAKLSDGTGAIKIMWFHQPYLAKKFAEGSFVKAVGSVAGSTGKAYLANPHVELADPTEAGLFATNDAGDSQERKLFAVYPESRGITSLWFRHHIEQAIASGVLEQLDDPLPENIRKQYHLPSLPTALLCIHTPEKLSDAEAARKRFAFEESFALQIARVQERRENDDLAAYPVKEGAAFAQEFLATLPFPATGAQRTAIDQIIKDIAQRHPMARLLEGDVGAGKTLVAAAAAYAVVRSRPPERENGTLQVAYMAPTEILAAQHFESFTKYFKDLPISIGLITGSGCKKFPSKVDREQATKISRAQLLKWVENGEIAMLIGTHALIQKSVRFENLALAIVDEQHRFGTRQRKELTKKNCTASPEASTHALRNSLRSDSPRSELLASGGAAPHFLSMTATPIPRTLALTIYGDLDLSVLDELPPGRAKITTKLLRPKERALAYEKIREELVAGRQAYVICPRIEEPDPEKENALQAKSAKAEATRLQKDVFPEYAIGLLHGGMKPADKDAVMQKFAQHEIDVLVATSVVEVGINVPNATAILIEGAERFGLAQLHQLRGRIMRSSNPPHCFLLSESSGEVSLKRLRVLERSSDGFKLAESDMEARGIGDLYGRKQWGVSDIGMEALKNPKLIAAAREAAIALIEDDPMLENNPALRAAVARVVEESHRE